MSANVHGKFGNDRNARIYRENLQTLGRWYTLPRCDLHTSRHYFHSQPWEICPDFPLISSFHDIAYREGVENSDFWLHKEQIWSKLFSEKVKIFSENWSSEGGGV